MRTRRSIDRSISMIAPPFKPDERGYDSAASLVKRQKPILRSLSCTVIGGFIRTALYTNLHEQQWAMV